MRTIVTDLIVATPFALCLALILWWAWRQETESRFADTLDRRFAKEKPKVKWWRTKDWPESTLEQRVTALEERLNRPTVIQHKCRQCGKIQSVLIPSTDSLPDTETPAEQGSTKTLSYSELFPASQGGTPKP